MPSPSSIFSSKLFGNAGLWALLIVLLLEGMQQGPLRRRYASHEVDQRVRELDAEFPAPPVLLLGDSVGNNWFQAFRRQPPGRFADFSTNQAIEMTGQYFMLNRYLDQHEAPELLVLMAGRPFYGDLKQVFTENFVLRVFTRFQEIFWIGSHSLDPSLLLKGLAYKSSPSFRYRVQLQQQLLGTSQVDAYSGQVRNAVITEAKAQPWSLAYLLQNQWRQIRGQEASETSWISLLERCREEGIDVIFLPSPTREQGRPQIEKSLRDVGAYQAEYPQLQLWPESGQTYPDDWFWDGTHLGGKGLEGVRPLQQEIARKLLQAALEKESLKANGDLPIDRYWLRKELEMPLPLSIEGLYPLEWHGTQPFSWGKPRIRIQWKNPASHLQLQLAEISPEITLRLHYGEELREEVLSPGTQRLNIPLDASVTELLLETDGWVPGGGDPRKLGFALEGIRLDP